MIKIESLSLTRGKFSLDNINLTIKKGEIHTLLGASGAGKSTILNAILGLTKIDSGAILLDDKDITNLSIHKRGFGYVPQNLALFSHLSVKENILYGLRALNKNDNFFDEVVKVANLKELLHRYPSNLSGGEKQRVALARAFVIKPKVLLLDEPFNALDSRLKLEMWRLLKHQSRVFDTTVIMVTHDLNEAYYLSDSISLIIDGKIVQSAPKRELFNRPANIEAARYFGIKNIFDAVAKSDNKIYIKDFDLIFRTKEKLKINRDYTVVIKDNGIKFVNKIDKLDNIIKGKIIDVIELQHYDNITFLAKSSFGNTNLLEFAIEKNSKQTDYIQIPIESIICYEK